jgi:capsular polysaccharide biosynthesis protein
MTVRERPRSLERDLEAEQEIDLGRYGRALAARWWLALIGLIAGAAVGYMLSLGGGTVYRAQAVVYLGQPLGILGGNQVQAPNTNPSAARAIVKSESVIRRVASDVGLSASSLRSGTSANPVQGAVARLGQTPLVQITVKGSKPARVAAAANALARILRDRMSGYSKTKITTLEQQLAADNAAIDQVNAALERPDESSTNKLILQLRLSQLQQDRTQTTQLLSLARNVEAPKILTSATAVKTTARSRRNSIVVGALIGLIIGVGAALLWEPVARRRSL